MGVRLFCRLVAYDIRQGFSQTRGRFLVCALVFVVLGSLFFAQAQNAAGFALASGEGSASGRAGITDVLLFFFQGMRVFIPSPTERFEIPILWMIQPVMIAFLVGSYPTHDLHSSAIQVIVRAKNKTLWWLSKGVWVILTVCAWCVLCLIVTVLFCFFFGRVSLVPDVQITMLVSALDISRLTLGQVYCALLVTVSVFVALALVQVLLSCVLNQLLSYLITMCYFIASIYYFSPFLLGDYPMLLRNALFYPGGYDSFVALGISALVALLALVCGAWYFNPEFSDFYSIQAKRNNVIE